MFSPTTTKIEWCDAVINICIGCLNNCTWNVYVPGSVIKKRVKYCYARQFAKKFWQEYAKNEGIKDPQLQNKIKNFEPICFSRRMNISYPKEVPKIYFVNSMSDWYYWDTKAKAKIIVDAEENPQHQFVILSKVSSAYDDMGGMILPDNLWLGYSCQSAVDLLRHNISMLPLLTGGKRILNLEPFVSNYYSDNLIKEYDAVIIGGMTGNKSLITGYHMEFNEHSLQSTLSACWRQNIKVFLKPNIAAYLQDYTYSHFLMYENVTNKKDEFWFNSRITS
jgi:protein gp37